MIIKDMFQEVQSLLSTNDNKLLGFGEFWASFLQVIRKINAESEKPNELVHISFNGDSQLIAEIMDETIATESEPIGGGIEFALERDETNNCIMLPSDWTKILSVFRNNSGITKMEPVPYDLLKKNDDYNEYTNINRNLYFNFSVAETTLDLWLKIRRNYPLPTNSTKYTSMPEEAYHLIMTGIVYSLLCRPQYRNQELSIEYKTQYYTLLDLFNKDNVARQVNTTEEPFLALGL